MESIKTNHMSVDFDAISENEAFARMVVALFMADLNPTISQIDDVKTAVSEAVTNAIIHGYEIEPGDTSDINDNESVCLSNTDSNKTDYNKIDNCKADNDKKINTAADNIVDEIAEIPQVHMECSYTADRCLIVTVSDDGVGIKDVKKALEPLYTSKPELERSGMGFSFMEAFMDGLSVTSVPGAGTTVKMKKML